MAVILTCAGLWFGSPLLLSSQAVSSIVVDLVWDLDVGWRLLSGKHLVGGTEYMWSEQVPLAVRLLSLFHVVWPVLLVWSLGRVGYDRRGFPLQVGIALCVLATSRAFGQATNLNFAFRDPIWVRSFGPAPIHLAVMLGGLVCLVYLPVHFGLMRALGHRADELLSKQRVFRDEFSVTANKIGGESRNEPKEVDHVWRLTPRGWHL